MKKAKELMQDYLSNIQNPDAVAALFTSDGAGQGGHEYSFGTENA